jgi:hypothetical protein
MISAEMRKVWFSPTKGRRYLNRRSAIKAEAHAKIMARYPQERCDYENGRLTYPGFYFPEDCPEVYKKMLRRLMRIISKHTEK